MRDSHRRGASGGSRVPGVLTCALPIVVTAALLGGCSSELADPVDPVGLAAAGQNGPGGRPEPPIAVPKVPYPAQRSPDGTFTVVATGDVLLHETVNRQARTDGRGRFDYGSIMAGLKPAIRSADLALCHLETPLAPARGPYTGYPVFSVPREIVPTLKDMGYDSCSTASNHTLDKGMPGVRRTLQALDQAGLRHAGSARSPVEARRPTIMHVRGADVAQLSYTYGFNGYRLPPGRPWMANLIEPARIRADARRARAAGADVVIVSLHWGAEYRHRPTTDQVFWARRLLAMPEIDLLVGHHAHVVQPFGRATNGKWVAYGLGNLVAFQGERAGPKHEGMMARFRFARSGGRWRVVSAQAVPTYIAQAPLRVLNVPWTLSDPRLSPRHRRFLTEVSARTARIARSRGTGVRPGM